MCGGMRDGVRWEWMGGPGRLLIRFPVASFVEPSSIKWSVGRKGHRTDELIPLPTTLARGDAGCRALVFMHAARQQLQ